MAQRGDRRGELAALQHLIRQILYIDKQAGGHVDRPFDDVFQFADVARPRILAQGVQGAGVNCTLIFFNWVQTFSRNHSVSAGISLLRSRRAGIGMEMTLRR